MPLGYRPRVFACYSHADALMVSAVVAMLDNAGVDVWQDADDLDAGRAWRDGILLAITESDAIIAFLGAGGPTLEQTAEVTRAIDARTPVVPCLLPGYDATAPPPPLDGIQAVDFRDAREFARSAAKLALAIRDLRSSGRTT